MEAHAAPANDMSRGPASYRAGPLSALRSWVARLPWGGWWFYVAFAVALLAWGQGVEWLTGRAETGALDLNLLVLIPYGPFAIGGVAIGTWVAAAALKAFWPATGWPDADRPAWEREFATVPFWQEIVALIVGLVVGVGALVGAPAEVLGPDAGRGSIYLAYLPAFLAGYGLLPVGVVTAVHWLRLVSRIHREATAVDVFDRVPIYAFSRLTVLVGISFLGGTYYSLTINGAFQAGNVASVVSIGTMMVFAAVVFVVPMWGIHTRLVREKEALLRDVERRTSALAGELYARIDAGRFESTAVVNDALAGIHALRERVDRLPTWPWPPQLFRGFVSALILPLVIFILTRVISDLL